MPGVPAELATESTGPAGPVISVFGLGKLGAVVAGCHAARGFRVIGVDLHEATVDACNHGKPPVEEPGIEELYAEAGGRLRATTDGLAAALRSDVSLITVPTPSEADGSYSLRYVLEACETIGRGIARKDTAHLVVLKSTILPGFCDARVIPALERASGRRCGAGLGFCYNPEFIALGSVIRDLYEPDFVLIGESDPAAGAALARIDARLRSSANVPVARMACVNAELAKLAVNTFVTMKITYANLLAWLCERLPGGDAREVTRAVGLDSRIGPGALKGGLGYGGPCFPRDNHALLALARTLDVPFPLAEATDATNLRIHERVADLVTSRVGPGGCAAVLGLSYKPNTAVVDESPGVALAHALVHRGLDVRVYDPLATQNARAVLGDAVAYATSLAGALHGVEIAVITTAWSEFRKIPELVGRAPHRPWIVDCWGLLDDRQPKRLVLGLDRTETARP